MRDFAVFFCAVAGFCASGCTSSTAAPAAVDASAACSAIDDALRLHQIQMLGTHNSYHVAKDKPIFADLNYTHQPLDVQLNAQGVRAFELDLHHIAANKPIVVEHIEGIDDVSSCPNLGACLQILKTWSDAHPCHHALVVLLEPKDELETSAITEHLPQVETEILAVWPRSRLVTPDDVRGSAADVKTGVNQQGWPTMSATRGKLVLVLYDKNELGIAYRKLHPKLKDAVAFVFGEPEDADTATVLRDNPLKSADIAALVQKGYLIRTFPEGNLAEGQAAVASGAQVVSTDFPIDRAWAPGYALHLPGGQPSRCNPVLSLPNCTTDAVNAGVTVGTQP